MEIELRRFQQSIFSFKNTLIVAVSVDSWRITDCFVFDFDFNESCDLNSRSSQPMLMRPKQFTVQSTNFFLSIQIKCYLSIGTFKKRPSQKKGSVQAKSKKHEEILRPITY